MRCLATFLALAAACSSVERPADWALRAPAPPPPIDGPGPYDPMTADGVWGTGDAVTFAIAVDDHGRRHGFTFKLTTTRLPAPKDPLIWAHPRFGRILTRTGNEEKQWGPDLVLALHGPAQVRAELCGDDGSACAGEFEWVALGHLWVDDLRVALRESVYEVFAALIGFDCMRAELLRVIRIPGLWSVVGNFGRIAVSLDMHGVDGILMRDEDTPFGRLPTLWRPFTIRANDQPALDGRIQFTWKRSPLLPCAGVLQIEGWHPDDPGRRVTVRLVAAHRGVPPDAPDPQDLGHGLRMGMTTAQVCCRMQGMPWKTLLHGRLADGRAVDLVRYDVPNVALVGVMHRDRLLYASAGEYGAIEFLAQHGFR